MESPLTFKKKMASAGGGRVNNSKTKKIRGEPGGVWARPGEARGGSGVPPHCIPTHPTPLKYFFRGRGFTGLPAPPPSKSNHFRPWLVELPGWVGPASLDLPGRSPPDFVGPSGAQWIPARPMELLKFVCWPARRAICLPACRSAPVCVPARLSVGPPARLAWWVVN